MLLYTMGMDSSLVPMLADDGVVGVIAAGLGHSSLSSLSLALSQLGFDVLTHNRCGVEQNHESRKQTSTHKKNNTSHGHTRFISFPLLIFLFYSLSPTYIHTTHTEQNKSPAPNWICGLSTWPLVPSSDSWIRSRLGTRWQLQGRCSAMGRTRARSLLCPSSWTRRRQWCHTCAKTAVRRSSR